MKRVAWLVRLARAEGIVAVVDRGRDRRAEARRRRSFAACADGDVRAGAWPVLSVSSAGPPVARLGGVQAQLGSRLAATEGPWALLYPEPGAHRLELARGTERYALRRPGAAPPASDVLYDEPFESAVRWALDRTGARALQLEGSAGVPLGSALRLARAGVPVIVAVHDFSLHCVRPHLLERPALRFCEWCRDDERCTRCLRYEGELDARHLAERRALAAELLRVAAAVVVPSELVRRSHIALFGDAMAAHLRVIPPAVPSACVPAGRSRARRAGRASHVAFVGWVQVHKGAHVFADVVRSMRTMGCAAPRFSAYGGGDPEILLRFRRLGVRVRGYHRSGTLPERLRCDGVDVAILPSIVPETYSLTLSECRIAGVPVVAFDLGALGERVRAEGGGCLVPVAEGAVGMARAVADVLRVAPPATPAPAPWDARRVAEAWAALHDELGLAGGGDA